MTDARITQEVLEQFTSTGDARVTQLVLEQFVNPATGNVQAIMTVIVLEQWTSVAAASTGQPPRAWIMA